ncbi:uncharacterized protein LOC132739975 [Ruditapes philippinarum]|uniref:uncharacterized protein LOC132739975 n=1 Tax=Ruditapes philippinarum TaxID=129788 RepID=UPI00295BF6FD|nr:uncharacterized protein LOC132739975 [Ruditapes philippinarum]
MTEQNIITPKCDKHPEEVAQVLCRRHRKLLCVSCALERATASECSIIEIRKLSTERDILLQESLAVKQLAENKKELVDRHESHIESMKSSLEQQVLDVHFRLTKRIDRLKDNCLKSIETTTGAISKRNKQFKQKLTAIENTAIQNIDKLSGNSTKEIDNIISSLEEVKEVLINQIPNEDSRPEGNFKPNNFLCSSVLNEDTSLGQVIIKDGDGYETVEEFPKVYSEDKAQETFNGKHIDSSETTSKSPYERPPYCVQFSSDEAGQSHDTEEDYLHPFGLSNEEKVCCVRSDGKNKTDLIPRHKSEKATDVKQICKNLPEERKTKSLFGRIFSNTEKPNSQKELETGGIKDKTHHVDNYCSLSTRKTENIYNRIELDSSCSITAEFFMNTTVSIPAIRPHFKSACKFCKLVYLGGSLIGMLSKVHNSLVIIGLDGLAHNRRTMLGGLINIAAVGKDHVALLIENGHRVCIVDVTSVGCSTVNCFSVHKHFQNITGFDFDTSSSSFALSSLNKLAILDKTGKVLISHSYSSSATGSNEITSVYDFNKRCLYILNIENRTLKCLQFNERDINVLWKCKYEDISFIPRSMCLYNDTICIACRDVIIQLFAEDGSLFMKHDAKDLLEDCLGVCVIDDVIVFTSNSNDFEKSTKLAYRKLL